MKFLLAIFFALSIISGCDCIEVLLSFLNFSPEKLLVQLTDNCAKSLHKIKVGIESEEVWAEMIRDVSGRSSAGFLWGNNFWLGQKKACNLLNDPPKIPITFSETRRMHQNVTEVRSKVSVNYRMFYANHSSPIQFDTDILKFRGLQIGVCFPSDCEEKEVSEMAEVVFQSEEFQSSSVYKKVSFVSTKVLRLREDFFKDSWTVSLM